MNKRVLVLGGGAQGKATIFDLAQNENLKEIIVVENNPAQLAELLERLNDSRIKLALADANNAEELLALFKKADVIIDLLPTVFRKHVADLAIQACTPLVNTSYQTHIEMCGNEAAIKGTLIMPEAGLDPGIDLILAGDAIRRFDTVEEFYSMCGGIPTKEACDNPINYKVTWIFEGVLSSYKRPADLIIDGKVQDIPGETIMEYAEDIEIEGVGKLERFPNGNASTYAKFLGIQDTVQNMGRYALRWKGHADFWKKIVQLGLIEDEPAVLGISPRKYLAEVLKPQLQYKDHEQDLVVLKNEVIGLKAGKRKRIVQKIIDKRDMKTGFMAMNRTVGFSASIVAQMILDGKITGKGILNPAKDIPYAVFVSELKKRDIILEEKEEEL
ncbi:MAG: saccharopine dehydrogenase NADP-binding domain-containing protein [Nanoarchaeota archaeon]|nr:saccharopine dehydrogenase NADP-binding domain-containing protein [Nanoarchaeota archaeon]